MVEYTAYIRLLNSPNSCEIEMGRTLAYVEIDEDLVEDLETAIRNELSTRDFGAVSFQILAIEEGHIDNLEEFEEKTRDCCECEIPDPVLDWEPQEDDEGWAEYLESNYAEEFDGD